MRLLTIGVVAAGLVTGMSNTAQAATLAICGAEAGQAYYAEGGLVTKSGAGWTTDRIQDGRSTLSRDNNGNYDVTFSDASGGVYSSREQGALVILQRSEPGESAFIVAYPGSTVEIYDYARLPSGSWNLIKLSSKGLPIHKGAVYVA